MIELERHIEILLLDNDCVIVPGLGGFMTNHVEARYDAADQLFLPPLRTLGFNPKLRVNDSLLAQSYIEAYDISYPEAMHRIEDEVEELKQHLKNEGVFELNDIGVLSMNEDGNYDFSPCEAGILTPSLYALDAFEIETIAKAAESKMRTPKPKTAEPETTAEALVKKPLVEVAMDDSQADGSARIVDMEPEEADDEARTVSIRVSVIRNVAAAAIALLVFMLFSTPLANDKQTTAAIDSGMLKRIMPKDVVKGGESIKMVAAPRQAEAESLETQGKEHQRPQNQASENQDFFTLVLASHVTKKNAAEYAERLEKEGYSGASVISKTSTKVIYGHFNSETEAYQMLNKLHDEEPFREAWVLHIK